MNLDPEDFELEAAENIGGGSGEPPKGVMQSLGNAINHRNKRCCPYIVRALLSSDLVMDPAKSKIKGEIDPEPPGNWPGLKRGKPIDSFLPRTHAPKGYIALEIPQSIIDAFNTDTYTSSGYFEMEHAIGRVLEISCNDYFMGSIWKRSQPNDPWPGQEGYQSPVVGWIILIENGAYRKLAHDVLSVAADPDRAIRLFGCVTKDVYYAALKDADSEPSKIIAKMYEAARLERLEIEALARIASSKENYEFQSMLRRLGATKTPILRRDNFDDRGTGASLM